jgi:hypothetical protein
LNRCAAQPPRTAERSALTLSRRAAQPPRSAARSAIGLNRLAPWLLRAAALALSRLSASQLLHRAALAAALSLVHLASAQGLRPLPSSAPQESSASPARVHVVLDEELEPDVLRAFARSGVTLWITTRSNTLKASTVETLARASEAFVQVRAPLLPEALSALRAAPRAGLWVGQQALGERGLAARGPRPLAVDLEGPLDEATLQALGRLRPSVTRWAPGAQIDLLSWAQLRALPGLKLLVRAPGELAEGQCPELREPREPALATHAATLLAFGQRPFPCGARSRITVPPEVDLWVVQALLREDPSTELNLEVGADDRAASRALKLVTAVLPR